MRVDLLSSCAKVLKESTGFPLSSLRDWSRADWLSPLRWPLLVELTLQARNLQRKDLWGSGGHSEIEACRELRKDFPEPPVVGLAS